MAVIEGTVGKAKAGSWKTTRGAVLAIQGRGEGRWREVVLGAQQLLQSQPLTWLHLLF